MLSATGELARRALDAAPDALIIIDGDGIIRFANAQASSLFGHTHEQLIGMTVELLMPERFRHRHLDQRHDYTAAPRARSMGQRLVLFGQHRDGREFPVEISLSPIRDCEQTLVAADIRDATERRRVEEELIVAREAAERARAAADRAREVATQARESADRANEAKSRFLATASHDLRQPLQTLALLNGALRRMIIHENAEQVLAEQEQAIAAMSRLLNALLDISKLESGAVRPNITDFEVTSLFEGLRREFAAIASSRGLALQVEASAEWAHSDGALVEQILKNLVSNAIKYTPAGRVNIRCVRQGNTVRIAVLDSGIGIPAEQLAYIYDEFYQVGVPANTTRDGYGLGLSIVQRLVKLLNLRLEVTSEVGRGSVFTLVLPVAASQGAAVSLTQSTPTPAFARHVHEQRVLLVEDDPGVRDATRLLLAVEGYRVTAVASKAEALRCVRENGRPDLLITDYHLAGGELGTQVIAALRESLGAQLSAILVTGDTSALVKHMTADPYLRVANKPINADELLMLVTELLSA